jgi:hypothetical protein
MFIPALLVLDLGKSFYETRAIFEGLFGSDVTFLTTSKKGEKTPISQPKVQQSPLPVQTRIVAKECSPLLLAT